MATYPPRLKCLLSAVASVEPQVDRLYLYLNNFREVPRELKRFNSSKIELILDSSSSKRAAAKFHWQPHDGYNIFCDDDIIYPANYVQTLCEKIEFYERRVVVGVHGIVYGPEIQHLFRSRIALFPFRSELSEDRPVHQLGTGTLAFHAATVRSFDFRKIDDYPSATDPAFAVLAKMNNVPLVAVSRPKNWLMLHRDANLGLIHEKLANDTLQRELSTLLMAHNPWPSPRDRGARE